MMSTGVPRSETPPSHGVTLNVQSCNLCILVRPIIVEDP